MPAKPGLMLRLMTMTVWAFVDVEDGHAEDGAWSGRCGRGVGHVVGADDEGTSVWGKSPLIRPFR